MKFIRVNMTTGTVSSETVPAQYAALGGRGLTSTIINEHVDAACDALGPENLLIFAPGLLSNTPLVNTGRLSVGGKSPLTGGIKESNAGGTMAIALARHGIKAVIVEGKAPAETLKILVIDSNGTASLQDAEPYRGMRNYALAKDLLARYGDKHALALAGPAGEQGLLSASIQITDPDGTPCRAAARGGLGAVMGTKGLKALVVSRKIKSPDTAEHTPAQASEQAPVQTPEPITKPATKPAPPDILVTLDEANTSASSKNNDLLKEAAHSFAQNIKRDGWASQVLPQYGTASILASTNAGGALPTRNARQGHFEHAEKIDGDTMFRIIKERGGQTTHKGCSKCIINCSNVYVDETGRPITSALEYETMWSMGAMTGIADLDVVARLDFLCDDIGLDTMNTGTALAVAMDAGHLEFGDAQGAVRLVEEVAEGTAMGRLIGHGPDAVGAHFTHDRVPTIKGQSIAGYDPRAMPGMGVTYATSTQGGDHTAGFIGGARGNTERLKMMSATSQTNMAVVDSLGVCMFAQSGGQDNMYKAIAATTGISFGPVEWSALGKRIMQAERDFNRRAGLTDKDNRLPPMFHHEQLSQMHDVVPYPEEELHGTLEYI